MSAMLGRKSSWGERSCDCCYFGHSKRSWKRREARQWRADVAPSFRQVAPRLGATIEAG